MQVDANQSRLGGRLLEIRKLMVLARGDFKLMHRRRFAARLRSWHMIAGQAGRLFILACDHRTSLQRALFGHNGQPTADQIRAISQAKELIYQGLAKALEEGVPRSAAAILIDERFGTGVARKAKQNGITFALAIERSGQKEFEFEYGDDFFSHIEEFDPNFCKALLRYNPEGDADLNHRQAERLKQLSDWLRPRNPRLMVELLVPPERSQLDTVGGDTARYDRELRPPLMRSAVTELQRAGVEADVWKIEGLDLRSDCEQLAALVRAGGRNHVGCVVLGRGADDATVETWMRQAARVPGYIGFAVGRTIWWDAVSDYLNKVADRKSSIEQIASRYRHFIGVYSSAE
jgi:myo-inositol catabolism protein IolC